MSDISYVISSQPHRAGQSRRPNYAAAFQMLSDAIATLILWRLRAVERRVLHGLSDAQLRDLGLTRAEVNRAAAKPFWRR